ncbi:MAG: BMP family ABC transporter substrate-binding protein [Clostridia bacterium]|nr:BMP family ABC transporter substrate-binding protein [Clostridia bacterium]
MKKLLSLIMVVAMILSVCAIGASADDFKVGVILVGDENEGYTYAHILGVRAAMAEYGLTDANVCWYYNIPEDETCYDKCIEAVEEGCKVVFTNSYSHQTYAEQAAMENPEVQFVSMTGDGALKSGLPNFSNAFNKTFESRYVSGVVAGMKIAELDAAGKIPAAGKTEDGKVKIGYVGAYPYAEVVSGYTGFYLGIKSIYPDVVMDVQYTNSWFNQTAEAETAQALMDRGCVIIGQHADSTGAPSAIQAAKDAGKVAYSVGYNVDMLAVAPTAALTSSTNDWGVYYKYAIGAAMKGEKIVTDWSEGYETGAVAITALGPEVAPGTAEKVAEVEAAIKAGTLHVFDINTFTVGGEKVEHCFCFDSDGDWINDSVEAIEDGYYHESEYLSAPSFSLRIDGITELN